MESLLLWIIGIIASIIITILLTDPLNYLLAMVFGSIVKYNRGIKGIWRAKYEYTSDGKEKVSEYHFLVKQFGKYVVAYSLDAPREPFKVRGKLDAKSILTGTWSSTISDNRHYHGAFQFLITSPGNEMIGKWIGFNRKNEIINGNWNWQLIAKNASKKELEKIISQKQGG